MTEVNRKSTPAAEIAVPSPPSVARFAQLSEATAAPLVQPLSVVPGRSRTVSVAFQTVPAPTSGGACAVPVANAHGPATSQLTARTRTR